jgi:hypothetical protein
MLHYFSTSKYADQDPCSMSLPRHAPTSKKHQAYATTMLVTFTCWYFYKQ